MSASANRAEEGIALMLVLVFIVLLSAIVVEYTYEAQVEASLSEASQSDFEAYLAAKSAIASGLALLHADLIGEDAVASGLESLSAMGLGNPDVGVSQDFDSLQDIWVQGVPGQMINEAMMQCSIDDECAKLNLNSIFTMMVEEGEEAEQAEQTEEPDPILEEALRYLFATFEVEEDPVDAILDWLDVDEDPRPLGAESDYYASLETPYPCKNGPMDSIEELLLIRGITPDLYFDCNRNLEDTSAVEEVEPLSLTDLLAVHQDMSGQKARINVNTARPEVLEAFFGALNAGNVAAVDLILDTRLDEPFTSKEDLAGRGILNRDDEADQAGWEMLDVRSTIFRVTGDAWANDTMVRVQAYVWRVPPEVAADETFRLLDWRVIR